jgi:hypothetical protein
MKKTTHYGFILSILSALLGTGYLLAILAAMLFDSIPPHEPFQSIISVVSLISVPGLIILWVAVDQVALSEKKFFSRASLALMIIFGTLTSLNRYVSLTVVPQAISQGMTDGLSWFQPYGWPSIMAASEVLAWGFYLGLALFCLAPVFVNGKLEKAIFWTLIVSGILCLVAALGQVLNHALLNMLGILAWGPGLITLLILLAIWFNQKEFQNGNL